MSERIEFKGINSPVELAMCSAFSACVEDDQTAIINAVMDGFEVELKINGIECKFSSFIELLNNQYFKQVETHALRLVEDRCDNLSRKIQQFEDIISAANTEAIKLFPEAYDD